MITKLCSFNNRSEFLIDTIRDLLKEPTNEQIMILAHNRNLLKYLHDAIDTRNIASVGYYVGGMKEADLKLKLRTVDSKQSRCVMVRMRPALAQCLF